jgi:chaperone required for assembly of F1-ATPase
MKRFYRKVAVAPSSGGFTVTLDGKPIRTPRKLEFAVPGRTLAEAVAREWEEQGDTLSPASMRLGRIANTAIDLVAGQREQVIRQVAVYAETDLLCYRATDPVELVARQAELWDPLLEWLAQTHGARLVPAAGVAPHRQDERALLVIAAAVAAFDSFALAALHMATAAAGSVVVALALAAGRLDAASAAEATLIDDLWQIDRWGADAEAVRRIDAIRADIDAAAAFLLLCRAEAFR